MVETQLRRCAVYTRKSSDEGLEQEFNSLHAQREACEAYILSQRHEGWRLVPKAYDDGGFSGGDMARPGLKALLADVKAGLVDVVVVYKIDRLTRSLADFARIVEVLDARQASFVSITQAFNTTTSMGRLTLNVLLSFAQFEREVTGERIRDKIAASKAKGMWMGGYRPLGYAIVDRCLVPHPTEAAVIVELFERYLACSGVDHLREEALTAGLFDRLERRSSEPMSRGALYHLLQNPLYAGRVRHKDKTYPGQHQAIVAPALFEAVQRDLASRRQVRAHGERSRTPALLTGLIFDARGRPYTPTHTVKGARRYSYYVQARDPSGPLARLPARELEGGLVLAVRQLLSSPARLAPLLARLEVIDFNTALSQGSDLASEIGEADAALRRRLIRALLVSCRVEPDRLDVRLRADPFVPCVGGATLDVSLPLALKRRGGDLKLVVGPDGGPPPHADESLVEVLARGCVWLDELTSGGAVSRTEIARREGVTPSYVGHLTELGFLAPDLKVQILEGRQPPELTASLLKSLCPLPTDWDAQRSLLLKACRQEAGARDR